MKIISIIDSTRGFQQGDGLSIYFQFCNLSYSLKNDGNIKKKIY